MVLTPEYLHVLLNPIPIYGVGIGVALLAAGLLRTSRDITVAALVVLMLATASAWPVVQFGEEGYDRVQSMSTSEGQKWLKTHAHRAHRAEPVFYVTAGLALAALVASRKKPAFWRPLTMAALIGGILCLGLGGWIGKAGGQIRHSEFRSGS